MFYWTGEGVEREVSSHKAEQFKIARRSLLVGALASTAIPEWAGAGPAREHQVQQCAEALAQALKLLHGGSWSIQISHETGFVSVSRDLALA